MISLLTPQYICNKYINRIKFDKMNNLINTEDKMEDKMENKMEDNRFTKLKDKSNDTCKSYNDEYINFKKRKSYTYNHYKNFNKKYNKNYPHDDTSLKDIKDTKEMKYIDNNDINSNNYIYNPVVESVNYPDIFKNINNSELSQINSLNVKLNVPITSYGIILYTLEKNKYLKYLLCQRRDSISYIQYLQDLIDETNIVKYINLMSKEEKSRCLEYYYKNDPHSIWKDLWINHNSKIYKNDYKRCTDVFMNNMNKYLHYFKDDNIGQKENTWCFPKGRMNYNENEIECALREFEEETCIPSNNISIDKNVKFEELYIGSNNLLYKTVYYVAYIPFIPKKIYKYYPLNIRKKFISSEFQEIEWMEYNTAIEHLNEQKKQVLENVNNYILKRSFKK